MNSLQEYSQEILDALPIAIFVKDTEGKYIACNGAFEAFLGKTSEQIINKTVYDLSPAHLADKYYQMDRILLEQPGIQRYEAKVKFADTTEHDVIFHKATFFDQNKKMTGIVGIIFDITEQRSAEAKTQQMQSELFITSKMAALGNLAAGIGHEINNPLTIINGQLHLLKRRLEKLDLKDEKVSNSISVQEKSIDRIVEIIRSMKSYSKNDPIALEKIDVDLAIKETNNLISSFYKQHDITTILELNCYQKTVLINRGKFQQILLNLYSNAHDAISERNPHFNSYIKTSTQILNNSFVVDVINNGPEIPKELQTKIFENFFTTKREGKGSGIGLSLSIEMMRSMKGTLSLLSSDDKETIFRISFPLV